MMIVTRGICKHWCNHDRQARGCKCMQIRNYLKGAYQHGSSLLRVLKGKLVNILDALGPCKVPRQRILAYGIGLCCFNCPAISDKLL